MEVIQRSIIKKIVLKSSERKGAFTGRCVFGWVLMLILTKGKGKGREGIGGRGKTKKK